MAKSDSTGLILLAVGGAAAYYAYTQGWLSFFGLCPSGMVAESGWGACHPAGAAQPAGTTVGAGGKSLTGYY